MTLVSLSINPVPSGADERSFEGYDGTHLRSALWQPTVSPCRGTVCLIEGRGEYIEKYFETIADLRRRGYAVAILDLRGQGGSGRKLADRRKGHVLAFTEYDRDLNKFMQDIVTASLPGPYFALGHSLGGNLLLRQAQAETSPFARMILISPMIEIHSKQLGTSERLARIYAETACLSGLATAYVRGGDDVPKELLAFEDNDLTDDATRFLRNRSILEESPDLAIGSPTIGWLRAALRSCALLKRPDYAKYVTVPMLVFAAGDDTVVSTRAIEDFAVDLKLGGLIRIPGSRHEILHESDRIRQRFWAAFDAYMAVDVPAREPV
jgi:lysophospholipase